MMENVPEVIGAENEKHFIKWCHRLTELGYQNYFKILNAKNYGIPQNRRRCFMISILGDYTYDFPLKVDLKCKLKDMLDKNVDEKYYLSQKHIEQIQSWGGYENPLKDIDKEKQVIGTLTTHCGKESNGMKLVVRNGQISKLTPCECIKLMGFERKDYESLSNAGLSDSAIYHCAGDSIVATVIMGLIGTMTNKDYRKIIKDYVERVANE